MSFASDMKNELTRIDVDEKNARAELSALIRMNGALSLSNQQFVINVQTENATTARRIYSLIKKVFNIEVEILVRKKMKLKKNNIYICRTKVKSREILDELGILKDGVFTHAIDPDMIQDDEMKRSYLRGAFLAGGSVNNPETSSYHLEIFSLYENHSEGLAELMNEYELNAKHLERKKGSIVYLKEAEKISDFLSLIGGYQAMLKFEDVRIVRDMRNSVNRLVNCETANLNKTVSAAMRQVESIQLIDQEIGIENLPERLKEIAKLRVENQDVSLKELGEMVSTGTISKSGVNHRLRKLNELADKIRSGEHIDM
ncbi:DNA-binding protein WhiA [Staphylococcus carnosus]|uniref:Probable cell division protein WhiA n=2 Tax=Staphylococcus carnosus TaxID=1281 RepID=WHIA_STACT|nr:DNA-binding protein WhiA [Staphylococcus carnosus]B9DJL1.1 RecName: Full=Probable cell division protein WhiA [Staphylococcus carnosus subsp. carnosus TM300]KKB25017.1 sporulation regulator WhiA [Staphylococcus carnosus]KOR14146.1 sporulation regulator WhiA [Staphylococcus carnosus]POA07866.1 DNA-binding protein WhiA [Staphylococcus carnosus]QPT03506.1 DNA-binding protein WhiA [Staphylococcus carnosus]QQS85903.1 DNA-binding protein WhiA [Staphylococcus carnosus]